jgi:phenylacetic acid degradation operon negative regulatory protein
VTRSLIARAAALPVPFSILSSIRFYRGPRGRGLPGTWFVELLGAIGVAADAVRQALYRLERQRVLAGRKNGRTKIYTPTKSSDAAVDVGANKLFRGAPEGRWDGMWTLVQVQLGPEQRNERNRILDVLRVEGFAPLAPGVFVHPRERSAHVLAAARDLGVEDGVSTFHGRRTDTDAPRVTAALWDLAVVRLKYERFLTTFEPLSRRTAGPADPRLAFAGRLVLVHDFLQAAWEDPDLPPELLPHDWPAERARQVARALYERWKSGGLAFGDEILARVTAGAAPALVGHRTGPSREG